jgi:hypothetical protein
VGQRLINQLVAEERPRGANEIAVEGWLAFVRAACVKWIQSQNISRADLTKMRLRALECALGTRRHDLVELSCQSREPQDSH